MEELKKIWERQAEFNKPFEKTFPDKEQRTKEMVLHIMSEADELLREVNWKVHRKTYAPVILSNLKEEWIDVFKYWLIIGQIWGFTPEDFIEEFHRKSSVVEQRYKQENMLNKINDKKVAAFDIDGVLAAYPENFLEFAISNYGVNWELKNVPDCFDKPSPLYNEIKDAYRQSGRKRYLDVKKGAKELLNYLKEKGYTIILLTARPYKQYKRIFADTKEWLDKNNIVYDAILWDENKNERIVREFPNLKFMVEDSLSNAKKVASIGYKVYWYKPVYIEQPKEIPDNIIQISDLSEVMKYE